MRWRMPLGKRTRQVVPGRKGVGVARPLDSLPTFHHVGERGHGAGRITRLTPPIDQSLLHVEGARVVRAVDLLYGHPAGRVMMRLDTRDHGLQALTVVDIDGRDADKKRGAVRSSWRRTVR
ncbi:hypothetical protein GCM10023335_56010 [Streptomyces siamensis]|uniref:Uncharacterized protein n=1 Tax=Streptomyces siamensis TaxID=1274986 RepID=A0ABP9J8C9_9ACTN